LDDAVDPVLGRLVLILGAGLPQRRRYRRRGPPALAGMGLVDDDGEMSPAVLPADLVEDEGKLLYRGDDDLLALGDERAQVAGVLSMAHRRPHLGELLDGVLDLLIEDAAIGDDDDGVE